MTSTLRRVSRYFMYVSLLSLAACSHTNNLAKYRLDGASLMYLSSVHADAARVTIAVSSPGTHTGGVVDILAGIGSGIATSEAQRKLDNAVRPEGVAAAIGEGIDRILAVSLGTKNVATREDHPSFIVETVLEECEVLSTESGLFLSIQAFTIVLDPATGRAVWDNRETQKIALRRTPAGSIPVPGIGTASSVFNATEFFRMSDRDIQDAIQGAATQLGERLGRLVREEYAESR